VCQLSDESTAALRAGDLSRAVERLHAVADEFPPGERRLAVEMSHRLSALEHPEGLITEDLLVRLRDRLVEGVLNALATYRSDADVAATVDSDNADCEPPADDSTETPAPVSLRKPGSGGDSAIQVDDVGWRVQGRWIVKHLSLELRPGSIVGLLGRNGAGKTTLLRLLAQEIPATTGSIRYPDLAARGMPDRRMLDRIAFVRQEPTPYVGRLEDHLRRYAALRGIRRLDIDDEVEFAIERFQLGRHRRNEWSTLSGGFRTRVDLARCLLASPDILILDEPLGPLDSTSQREYLVHLKDVAASRRGVCIVITSQDIHAVADVADFTIVLSDGRMSYAGAANGVDARTSPKAFEFAGQLELTALEPIVSQLPGARLIDRGLTRVLLTDPSVTTRDVLEALIARGETIRFFRDLSRSPHALIDVPEDEHAHA
jgi:lipopolysaccharide export system ATP-binding protein